MIAARPKPTSYCPRCIGHRAVTCDGCWGFTDAHSPCDRCASTGLLDCPECVDGAAHVDVFVWR